MTLCSFLELIVSDISIQHDEDGRKFLTIQENRVTVSKTKQGRLSRKSIDDSINPKIYEAGDGSVCLVKLAEFYLSKLGKKDSYIYIYTYNLLFQQYIVGF